MNKYWGSNIEQRPGEIARNESANDLMRAMKKAKDELIVGQKIKIAKYEMKSIMIGNKIEKVLKKRTLSPYIILDFYPDYILCESCSDGHYKECFRYDDVAKSLGLFRNREVTE